MAFFSSDAETRKPVGRDIMNKADEEHHVAKVLIAEPEGMDGSEDHYDAKFTVLAEKGVPPAAEEAMVATSHGKGDSQDLAAHKTKSRASKKPSGN